MPLGEIVFYIVMVLLLLYMIGKMFRSNEADQELEQFYEEEERIVDRLANGLKSSGYRSARSTNAQLSQLESTAMLQKYDDWMCQLSPIFRDIII